MSKNRLISPFLGVDVFGQRSVKAVLAVCETIVSRKNRPADRRGKVGVMGGILAGAGMSLPGERATTICQWRGPDGMVTGRFGIVYGQCHDVHPR